MASFGDEKLYASKELPVDRSSYFGVVPLWNDDASNENLAGILDEALNSLESVPCTFWACEGYNVEPVHMVTCNKCHAMREVQQVRQTLIWGKMNRMAAT